MTPEQYKTLILGIQHQLRVSKDDYKAGRVDIKTLQYVAKRLQAVQQQVSIEYSKTK